MFQTAQHTDRLLLLVAMKAICQAADILCTVCQTEAGVKDQSVKSEVKINVILYFSTASQILVDVKNNTIVYRLSGIKKIGLAYNI